MIASFYAVLLVHLTDGPREARLPVIDTAPAFALVDQSGKSGTLKELKGQVFLVSFIFTTCNGSCPATTHRMARIQEEAAKRGLFKQGLRLVSITLDPARDTPEVLRGYMRLYDLDPKTWSLLTGPPTDLSIVVAA